MSQAVLRRDPGNIQAKTVQRVVERQAAPPAARGRRSRENGSDLNLVRTAQAPAAAAGQPSRRVRRERAGRSAFPPDGALVDQFDESGALLDEVEQQKRVFAQMLRREVENTIIDARRTMADDPDAAGQQLKLTLQNVERAPELNPDMRSQLIDKLQIALREVQRQASIKDELDAAREEQLAAARERQLHQRAAGPRHRAREATGRPVRRAGRRTPLRRSDRSGRHRSANCDPDGVAADGRRSTVVAAASATSIWPNCSRAGPVARIRRHAVHGRDVVDSVPG